MAGGSGWVPSGLPDRPTIGDLVWFCWCPFGPPCPSLLFGDDGATLAFSRDSGFYLEAVSFADFFLPHLSVGERP